MVLQRQVNLGGYIRRCRCLRNRFFLVRRSRRGWALCDMWIIFTEISTTFISDRSNFESVKNSGIFCTTLGTERQSLQRNVYVDTLNSFSLNTNQRLCWFAHFSPCYSHLIPPLHKAAAAAAAPLPVAPCSLSDSSRLQLTWQLFVILHVFGSVLGICAKTASVFIRRV